MLYQFFFNRYFIFTLLLYLAYKVKKSKIKRITLLYSKFDFSTFFAFKVFCRVLNNFRKKITLLHFNVKLTALIKMTNG